MCVCVCVCVCACACACVANPLNHLTCKGVTFQWSEDCQAAFSELKKRSTKPLVLCFLFGFCIASHQGLGAVLSQQQADGKLHPVVFASSALAAAEKNNGITDLKLEVVWAISHFHYYLYGHCFTVYIDHSACWRQPVFQVGMSAGEIVFSNGIKQVTILHRAGWDKMATDVLSQNPKNSPLE